MNFVIQKGGQNKPQMEEKKIGVCELNFLLKQVLRAHFSVTPAQKEAAKVCNAIFKLVKLKSNF